MEIGCVHIVDEGGEWAMGVEVREVEQELVFEIELGQGVVRKYLLQVEPYQLIAGRLAIPKHQDQDLLLDITIPQCNAITHPLLNPTLNQPID